MHISEKLPDFSFRSSCKLLLELRILLGSPDSGGSRHLCIRSSILSDLSRDLGYFWLSAFQVNCRMIRSSIHGEAVAANFSQCGGALAVIQFRTILGYFLRQST